MLPSMEATSEKRRVSDLLSALLCTHTHHIHLPAIRNMLVIPLVFASIKEEYQQDRSIFVQYVLFLLFSQSCA